MMKWVNDNQAALNIVALVHTGDITNNNTVSGVDQRRLRDGLLEIPPLPGLPDGVPYGVLPGNHDGAPATRRCTTSTSAPPILRPDLLRRALRVRQRQQLHAVQCRRARVHRHTAREAPSAAVLDWADALLKTYSDRRAIVGSHYIMEVGENAPMSSEGLAIYNALKDNPNLFLMLCGHMHGEGKRYDDYQGRRVWTMIADYQDVDGGVGGWMRLLRFSAADNKIHVQTYSPTANGGARYRRALRASSNSTTPRRSQRSGRSMTWSAGEPRDLPWPGRGSARGTSGTTSSDSTSTTTGPYWTFASTTQLRHADATVTTWTRARRTTASRTPAPTRTTPRRATTGTPAR